jgi:hypothetical protein
MEMKPLMNFTFIKMTSAFLLLLIGQIVYSQTPQGHYEGALTRDGSVQLVSFDFYADKTTYDIPEIGYMDVLTDKIFRNKDTLNLKIFYGDFYCFLDAKTGDLTGISKEMLLQHLNICPAEKTFTPPK